MKAISIYNPKKLVFGPGCIDQMFKDYIASGKKKLFILSIEPVLDKLKNRINNLCDKRIQVHINVSLKSEPSFIDAEAILFEAREFSPDTILGIGGGSIMDLAKILAAFITNRNPIKDYVGNGLITGRETNLICVPTTSGTGSEVSPNSILIDETNNLKKGIISEFLVPDATYIDPLLTMGLDPFVTAYTGMDALTHCIEAYVNVNAQPFTDTLALKGISLISNNLLTAVRDINDVKARTNLALGSLYGGMCLGPVNTAAVHALAYPLGSDYKMPHGLSNALLLPHVMEFNLDSAEERYAGVAGAIGINGNETQRNKALKGIEFIKTLISDCNLDVYVNNIDINYKSIYKMAVSALEVKRLLKNNVREVNLKNAIEIYQKVF